VYCYSSSLRHDLRHDLWHDLRATPAPTPPLHEERPTDLLSMRLLLVQHVEELRLRGAPETVLRPIENELRQYSQTVDELVHLSQP
jgi:hypothetical protein